MRKRRLIPDALSLDVLTTGLHIVTQMKQVCNAVRPPLPPRSLEHVLLFCRGGWLETSVRGARIKSDLAADYTLLDISLGTELLTRP
jgi:hypothetical protein